MTEPVYYFDCFCCISGDMTVAALLDLGADRAKLDAMIAGLNLDGFDYTVKRVVSGGFDACDFDVVLHDEGPCNRHHEHHHDHDHHHHHGGDHHHHEHRNIRDIRAIIDRSGLSERAKTLAVEMFDVVAEAEAEVHGRPVDEVHFHEVGAIDSIIDILSIAFCIDDLGIKRVAFSPLTEGCGTVMCQHGEIPVPVPAVASIARKYGIPLRLTETRGERVTPTGIAVVAALKNAVRPQDAIVDAVGVGAGKQVLQGRIGRGGSSDKVIAPAAAFGLQSVEACHAQPVVIESAARHRLSARIFVAPSLGDFAQSHAGMPAQQPCHPQRLVHGVVLPLS